MTCTALVKLVELKQSQLGVAADIASHLQKDWLVLGLPTAPLVQDAGQDTLEFYFPDLVSDPEAAYATALRALLDARREAHQEHGIGADGWDPINTVEGIQAQQIKYEKTCIAFPGGVVGLFAHRLRTFGSGAQAPEQGDDQGPIRGVVPTIVRTSGPAKSVVAAKVPPEIVRLYEGDVSTDRIERADVLRWLDESKGVPKARGHAAESRARRSRAKSEGDDAAAATPPDAINAAEAKLAMDAAPAKPRGRIQKGDSYLAKLAKYIPAEITGLFLVLGSLYQPWRLGDAVICWALTPAYLWATSRGISNDRQPRAYFYLLSFCAFPFWALAVDSSLGGLLPYGVTVARGQATTMMMFAALVIPAIDGALDQLFPRRAT